MCTWNSLSLSLMISGQEIHWKFSGFSNKSNIFFILLHSPIWIFHHTKSVVHPKRFPDTQYYFPGPLLSENTRPWPIGVNSEKPHNYEKMPENFIRTHARSNTPSEYKDTIPLESLTKKNSFFNGKIQILESVWQLKTTEFSVVFFSDTKNDREALNTLPSSMWN